MSNRPLLLLPFTALHTFLLSHFFTALPLDSSPLTLTSSLTLTGRPSDGSGGTSQRLKRRLVRRRQHCMYTKGKSFLMKSLKHGKIFIAGVRYKPENHSSQNFSSLKSGSDRAQMTPICSLVIEPPGNQMPLSYIYHFQMSAMTNYSTNELP